MIKRTKIRSNGITFLYEQDQGADSVTAALFFKAGNLWEKPREYGITYLLARLLLREISENAPEGLTVSLRCERDHAAFLCAAPPDRAQEAVTVLAGLFDAPLPDAAAIEQTRDDVLRELSQYVPHKEDVDERLYFDRPNYDVPLYGTAKTVSALPPEKLEKWRELRFTRANACFVLTGAFTDGDGKAVEKFLREQPPQKHKSLNSRPVFPGEQFFRTSAGDRFPATNDEFATVTLLFEIDLCESKPVYAELLRRILTDPDGGVVNGALLQKKLTDRVTGTLRYYTGFAVLAISYPVFHSRAADSITLLADTVARCRNSLKEAMAAPYFDEYRTNRLYRRAGDDAYGIGLHNFILYTDDVVLPEGRCNDAVMERLLEAANLILIPDNAVFIVRYDKNNAESEEDLRRSVIAARIRLFV